LSFVAHFARSATFATISASEPSTPSARIVTLRSGCPSIRTLQCGLTRLKRRLRA